MIGAMRLLPRVVIAGGLVASACSPSYDRFSDAREVARALNDGGVQCDFVPEGNMTGPIIVPKGESWGGCNMHGGGLAIYVLGDKDALTRLRSGEAKSSDDTPRIYWVYGDNWIVSANNRTVQAEVHAALGGELANNTEL